MIAIPFRPGFRARPTGDAQPCVVCGAPASASPFVVHVHRGGSHVVTEAEAAALPANEDLGLYPIGARCLRRHPELEPYARTQAERLLQRAAPRRRMTVVLRTFARAVELSEREANAAAAAAAKEKQL